MMVKKIHTKETIIACLLFIIIFCSFVQSSRDGKYSIASNRGKRQNELEHAMDFRIIGGTDASIKDFPFMASLQMRSNHICGGTILTKSIILTAAHCVVTENPIDLTWTVQDPLEFNIVAGQTVLDLGECQFRDVKKIYVHSSYNHTRMSNDIALIEIFGLLEWTKYTKVAEIYSQVHSPFESHDFCTAIGWGSTKVTEEGTTLAIQGKNILQQVDLHPSLRSTCERFFAPAPHLFDETKLCVIINEEKDTCVGDSGGPFICDGVQYGITSFGLGCAQLNMPGVFTNISAFHDWIYGILNNTETLLVSRMVEIVNLTRNSSIRNQKMHRRISNSQTSTKYFVSLQHILVLFIFPFFQILKLYNN